MRLHFTKMSGAGNDFVLIDNRSGEVEDGSVLALKLCDRRWGAGADGLLLLEKSLVANYKMLYFNADGSYGGMCGNGGRCIADFAKKRGIAPAQHSFEALEHVYRAEVTEELVELTMKDPIDLQTDMVLPIRGKRWRVHYVDTGSPHVVVLLKKPELLEEVDVERLGCLIRNHPRFRPNGTNVNFVKVSESKSIAIRTYERGVEAETMACGTGSIAAAVVGQALQRLRPPIEVTPRSGVSLYVDFETAGGVRNVRLKGPAKTIFEGVVEV